jgi:uncharacterized membrane protein YfcA
MAVQNTVRCRFFQRAFGWCVPIGALGGLIGLGGGEFRLPVLIYAIGILSGLWRYWRIDGLPRGRGGVRITGAMSARSIIGAVLGGLAVAFAPVAFLKVLLGCVLLAAAVKTIASHRRPFDW